MKAKKTEQIIVRMTTDDVRKVEAAAAKLQQKTGERATISNAVRVAVEDYLKRK